MCSLLKYLQCLTHQLQAANVTGGLTNNTAWTILAPTNEAFESRLADSLGITPEQLLEPENRATLVDVSNTHHL